MDAQTHYNEAYEGEQYREAYEVLPEWARAMNRWHVDFVIALLDLSPECGPILDLGSGMGHYLSAWEDRGFVTRGREVSDVAIRKSRRVNIDRGDATDLRSYSDDQFQLVFSAAFLEHVDDTSVARLIDDELRIAKHAAHFISHDHGNDPGHINIKSPKEWFAWFTNPAQQFPGTFLALVNPVCPVQPPFLHVRNVPAHIAHSIKVYGGKS